MTNSQKKLSELATTNTVSSSDMLIIIYNANSSPSDRGITVNNFITSVKSIPNLLVSNTAPANSTANGVSGTLAFDSTHVYVCIANNTWMRSTLASW